MTKWGVFITTLQECELLFSDEQLDRPLEEVDPLVGIIDLHDPALVCVLIVLDLVGHARLESADLAGREHQWVHVPAIHDAVAGGPLAEHLAYHRVRTVQFWQRFVLQHLI